MTLPHPSRTATASASLSRYGRGVSRARELRRRMTPCEARLWHLLRNRALHGLKFRRQHPIGGYVADFCCPEKRLIVELDGSIHSKSDQQEYDRERDSYLRSAGFKILRFSNGEVEEKILQKILESSTSPSRAPLPHREREVVSPDASEG